MGMKLGPIYQKVTRWLCVMLLVVASGGSTFVLGGCDPEVSGLVLAGFNDLSVTFVDAFFTLLANQAAEDQAESGGDLTGGGGGST